MQEVSGWINKKAKVPVWSKMTPNITDITLPARTALEAGSDGIAAINTITSVMGINLNTLRPEPSVEGHSTPGGYSCKAVKPIALAKVGFRFWGLGFRVYVLEITVYKVCPGLFWPGSSSRAAGLLALVAIGGGALYWASAHRTERSLWKLLDRWQLLGFNS